MPEEVNYAKTVKLSPELTPEQDRQIRLVIAVVEKLGMHPSEEDIRDLEEVAMGRKTIDDIITEMIEKHRE